MPELEMEDVRVFYRDQGEGPPVTFLHGFTQDSASWDELLSLMAPRWRWIRLDLRGHGLTVTAPGEANTMAACLHDLERVWDHLGVDRSHLVGYSLGGRLALHAAAHRGARLLTLTTVGAHAGMAEADRAGRMTADEELASRIEREGIGPFVEYWSALPMFKGQGRRGRAFLAKVREQRLRNHPSGLASTLRGMGGGAMEPVWNKLATFSGPSLFLAGAEDRPYVAYAERLARAVPNGKAVVVADAGHAVHLEQPSRVAELLTAHLSSR